MKRQARAQRPGGGRVAAQEGVEQGEAGAGEEEGILVCPAARPRPGRNQRGQRRKGLSDQGVRGFPRRSCAPEARRRNGTAEVGEWVGNQGRVGANHFAMMSLARRFVDCSRKESALLVVLWGCPIRLQYQSLGVKKVWLSGAILA